MQRVKVTRQPPYHSTGQNATTCTCKGQTGELRRIERVGKENLAIVKLDKGGTVGIPMNCLKRIGVIGEVA